MKLFLFVISGLLAGAQTTECLTVMEEANCTSDNGCTAMSVCGSADGAWVFTCLAYGTAEECNADTMCGWAALICGTKCGLSHVGDKSACDADDTCTSKLSCRTTADLQCSDHQSTQTCEAVSDCSWKSECSVKTTVVGACMIKDTTECIADPECGDQGIMCTPTLEVFAQCMGVDSGGCSTKDNCEWTSKCGDKSDNDNSGNDEQFCSASNDIALQCYQNSAEQCETDATCMYFQATCIASMEIQLGCTATDAATCNAIANCAWQDGSESSHSVRSANFFTLTTGCIALFILGCIM